MRALILIAAALLANCGAAPSIRTEIAALEFEAIMPDGASRLQSYARFYTVTDARIEGEYVSGGILRTVLDHRVVRERLAPDVYLVDANNMPAIDDGGCSVLTLSYDRKTHALTGPTCNGLA